MPGNINYLQTIDACIIGISQLEPNLSKERKEYLNHMPSKKLKEES